MSKAKTTQKAGRLSISEMRDLVNKKAGMNVAHDLQDSNPTEVTDWIPTGSRWLDSIICRLPSPHCQRRQPLTLRRPLIRVSQIQTT